MNELKESNSNFFCMYVCFVCWFRFLGVSDIFEGKKKESQIL